MGGTISTLRRGAEIGGQGTAFSVTELSELPPKQRVVERYRALASDARRQAAFCNGARESYLLMAHHWEILAKAVEATVPEWK